MSTVLPWTRNQNNNSTTSLTRLWNESSVSVYVCLICLFLTLIIAFTGHEEEEAWTLRQMQANVEKRGSSGSSASQTSREEVDLRSIYVGNVDYACTAEEVRQHFQPCGTVNRVTILTNQYGQPKGFAYVEFVQIGGARNALLLDESVLHGRKLKVSPKRTNVPGMKQYHGPRPFASGSRGPPPFYPTPGYGRGAPRFRPPMRYRPY